jgi:Mg2+ and Co2+ transporter CorA
MIFLNFSQLPKSIFRLNFPGKYFPENQAKFFLTEKYLFLKKYIFFYWKVFKLNLHEYSQSCNMFNAWFVFFNRKLITIHSNNYIIRSIVRTHLNILHNPTHPQFFLPFN